MTSPTAELCRVTVFGPDKRVDLAVPVSISISSLLPVLLRHTSEQVTRNGLGGSWVLQRLGGEPMLATETPQSLDWHEGEQLYLRRSESAFPQLYFDDVADGMATTVSGLPGRWRAEYNRWLFLGLSLALLLLIVRIVLDPDLESKSEAVSAVFAVLLTGGSIALARLDLDRLMILLLGLAGCGFAALSAAIGDARISGATHFGYEPVLAGTSAAAVVAVILILARLTLAPAIGFIPFGVVVLVGACVELTEFLYEKKVMTSLQIAGTLASAMLLVLVFSPRAVIRIAGLHVPQLPRTAEEMQHDVAPASAPDLARRTRLADECLAVVTVCTAVVLAVAVPVLVRGGLYALILEGALLVSVLVRAAGCRSIWQRVPLTASGAWAIAVGVMFVLHQATPTEQILLLMALGAGLVALLLAMGRQPGRRLLPIWGQVANWFELLSAAATLPLVLELFGVYVWARGLIK